MRKGHRTMMERKLPFHLELLIEGIVLKKTYFKQIYSKEPRNENRFPFFVLSDNMFLVEPAEITTTDGINTAAVPICLYTTST